MNYNKIAELYPIFKDWYYKKYRYMGADGAGLIALWYEFIEDLEENIKWTKEFKWNR